MELGCGAIFETKLLSWAITIRHGFQTALQSQGHLEGLSEVNQRVINQSMRAKTPAVKPALANIAVE